LHDLQERMRKFELALHPAKTRLIRFGRHAAKQREELGEGKPEPFDFLGFTHFCTRSRKWGSFVIGRKTIKKRMLRQLQALKMEAPQEPRGSSRHGQSADKSNDQVIEQDFCSVFHRQPREPVEFWRRVAIAVVEHT
jgi:hypothetical protein